MNILTLTVAASAESKKCRSLFLIINATPCRLHPPPQPPEKHRARIRELPMGIP